MRRLVATGVSLRQISREGLVRIFVRGGAAVVLSEAAIRKELRTVVA